MKTQKIVALVLLVTALVVASGCGPRKSVLQEAWEEMEEAGIAPPVTAVSETTETETGQALTFNSTGDYISGWYWLRDENVRQYGEWVIEDVPREGAYLVLDMEVLATDTFNGEGGESAEITFHFGDPANKGDYTKLYQEIVTIPNTSPESDPLKYTCTGKVYIPHLAVGDIADLYVRAQRTSQVSNHVAVNENSIKAVTISDNKDQ